MATRYMNMDLPIVEVTTGPEYAEMLNLALSEVVDAHNHTSGNGAPIPSSAMNINADLDFQQWAAINLESTQYTSQSAEPDGTHFTYFLDADFYVVDGNGVSVRITENGAISAASFGGITGLVAPASASFATDTFTWLYDTDEYALMASGPLLLHRDGEVAPDRIKITPPANLAAAYDLTLPGALPASNAYLYSDNAGTLAFTTTALASSVDTASIQPLAVTTAKIAALNVTREKIEAVGQQVSSSCGTFDYSGTSFTAVTNLNVSLTVTTTRPIVLTCVGDGTSASLGFRIEADTTNYTAWSGKIVVSGAATADIAYFTGFQEPLSTTGAMHWPPSTISTVYVPGGAGTYTFTVQIARVATSAPSTLAYASNMRLVAYQL